MKQLLENVSQGPLAGLAQYKPVPEGDKPRENSTDSDDKAKHGYANARSNGKRRYQKDSGLHGPTRKNQEGGGGTDAPSDAARLCRQNRSSRLDQSFPINLNCNSFEDLWSTSCG
jgi:hypothetical protein